MYILESHERVTPEGLRWLDDELDDPEQEVVMTAAERLRQEGRDEVMTLAENLRQEGRQEGQRRVLLKQLGLRFGQISPGILARVEQAGSDDLERWAERILTASSLDEVLQ
jgi:hypothetical protein